MNNNDERVSEDLSSYFDSLSYQELKSAAIAPETSETFLCKLANHKYAQIRWLLTQHKTLPYSVLSILINDRSAVIASTAKNHPSFYAALFERALNDGLVTKGSDPPLDWLIAAYGE